LLDVGVKSLVDVRARAWSHRPEFRKSKLKAGLEDAGITYVHLKAAGNPFRPKKGEVKTADDCLEDYRQHLRNNPDVLDEALSLVKDAEVAFFCYEKASSDCHRSVLVEEMRERFPSLRVEDL